MSAAIAELERLGFVELVGAVQGPIGRSAAQYRIGSGAGHVIAVDVGSTNIRLRISTLDRRLLLSRVLQIPSSQVATEEDVSRAVSAEVAAALVETCPSWGPLRVLGLAIPARVVGQTGVPTSRIQQAIFSKFCPPEGVAVVLENNVNCAAVAERHYGAALGEDNFAYIQIGLKIGMGLMLGGQLVRGRNGAAGEIGHLSYPFAPGVDPLPGEAEHYLGAEAYMARVVKDWPQEAGPPPADTAELLALAEGGNLHALRHVARHSADIGAVVATCVSVVDPGLIVLGGGLGAAPMLASAVHETANRLSYAVEVRSSLLGAEATVLGIERLAIVAAEALLLGADY